MLGKRTLCRTQIPVHVETVKLLLSSLEEKEWRWTSFCHLWPCIFQQVCDNSVALLFSIRLHQRRVTAISLDGTRLFERTAVYLSLIHISLTWRRKRSKILFFFFSSLTQGWWVCKFFLSEDNLLISWYFLSSLISSIHIYSCLGHSLPHPLSSMIILSIRWCTSLNGLVGDKPYCFSFP